MSTELSGKSNAGFSKADHIVILAIHIADGQWELVGLTEPNAIDYLFKFAQSIDKNDGADAPSAIRKIEYGTIQNKAMALRRGGNISSVQQFPEFSYWGCMNMIKLTKAYQKGGAEAFEREFHSIFHNNWEKSRPKHDVITFKGGSGESKDEAIIIENAPDHGQGIASEYWYLNYTYGFWGDKWKLLTQTLTTDSTTNRRYDVLTISLKDGAEKFIYFDITDFYNKNN